jgi:hypothetical protein
MNKSKLLANRIEKLKDKKERELVFRSLERETQGVIKILINNMMVSKYERKDLGTKSSK